MKISLKRATAVAPIPSPCFTAVKKFIRTFHPTGQVVTQVFSKNATKKKYAEVFNAELDAATKARLIAADKRGMEIAVLTNTSKNGGRKKEDIDAITAVFIDSDDQELTLANLLALNEPPHIVVETSPDRFHAYWKIADCTVNEFGSVQRALAAKFGTDESVADLSRVMRLPGTVNYKRNPPFLTKIVACDDRPAIKLEELVEKLELDVVAHGAPDDHQPSEADQDIRPAEIKEALSGLSSEDRKTWLRAGMAVHSALPEEAGYGLWTDWSKGCEKFDAETQRATWNGFTPGAGINIATLFWMARRARHSEPLIGDDVDAAMLFAETFKSKLRYEPKERRWYLFDGVKWTTTMNGAEHLAQLLIADLKAGEGGSDPSVTKYRSFTGIRNIVKAAELLEVMHIDAKVFDQDPNLFAVSNGVIGLTTGAFRSAAAEDYLSRAADVDFIAGAKCPLWNEFIKQITCGDKALAFYLRRAIGYTMFGHADAQVFFVLEGSGGNGKGVLLRVLKKLFGGYGCAASPILLTTAYAGNVNAPTPALAALNGQRMCIVTELPARKAYDTAFLKQFAGGDEITARKNYGDPVTFKPSGKLWVSTNEMPQLDAADQAMWRRLVAIPFKAIFEGDNRDNKLDDKLWAERSGILNWAVKGALSFVAKDGLGSCAAVDANRRERRRDSDSLGQWLKARCLKAANGKVQASKLWASYFDFTNSTSGVAMTQKQFRDALAKRGVVRKTTNAFNVYLGIKFKD